MIIQWIFLLQKKVKVNDSQEIVIFHKKKSILNVDKIFKNYNFLRKRSLAKYNKKDVITI